LQIATPRAGYLADKEVFSSKGPRVRDSLQK
jgi:hypothetical protein